MHMKNVISFLLLCFSLATANGQGWEHLYPFGPDQSNGVSDLIPTPDGGFLLRCRGSVNPPPFTMVFPTADFYKLAANGSEQWRKTHQELFDAVVYAMAPAGSNRMLFLTYRDDTTRLVKTDANFQPVWTLVLDAPGMTGYNIHVENVAGGHLVMYQQNGQQGDPVRMIKVNSSGALLWAKDVNVVSNFSFRNFASDEPGNLYLFGEGGNPFGATLGKVSPTGSLLFTKTYASSPVCASPILLNDNLLAYLDFNNHLRLIDAEGLPVTTLDVSVFAYRIARANDGNILVGYSADVSEVGKITPDGTVIWSQAFNNINAAYGKAPFSLWSLPDGGTVTLFQPAGGTQPFYVVRTDANGQVYTNQVHGRIFADVDGDCNYTSGQDFPAPGVSIIAQKGPDFYYATTDSLGDYAMTLDTGTYLLRVLPPGGPWLACDDSLVVNLNPYDTITWNTGINTLNHCPWPGVNLTAPFLRRCFTNSYQVTYGNSSDVVADSAIITLTLDPFLTLQTASLPFTSLGNNLYEFQLGDLGPLQTGAFNVEVQVDCSAELGQTHCSSAEISIANPCPEPALEVPVIQVTATCEGDSVAFRIRNEGGAPMPAAAEFVIIEDLIIMRQGQFQLPAQAETTIKCPATGTTSRIYAGQAPGEPPFFATTTAIEGCNGPIQAGYWNMYPEIFVRQDFVRDCQPNIGSFDPNDKQAVPTGYATEHYIGRGVGLDYKIRFQNTGTDTAFNVVVRDTLSPWLEAATVRPGAASHPYTWQLLGVGVIQFAFSNLQLPDSLTDLAGSQGFISFHIDQKPELPLQTLIENRAAIFFDFNAPVLTNTTFHRVGEKFVVVSAWEPANARILVQAVPNPFTAETRLDVQGLTNASPLYLQVFDLQGRKVVEMQSADGVFQVKKGALEAGMYMFQITQEGRLVGRGKLMVQ